MPLFWRSSITLEYERMMVGPNTRQMLFSVILLVLSCWITLGSVRKIPDQEQSFRPLKMLNEKIQHSKVGRWQLLEDFGNAVDVVIVVLVQNSLHELVV